MLEKNQDREVFWKPGEESISKRRNQGTSLAVQWLRFCTSNTGGTGSKPGRGTKIPHLAWSGQKIKK